MKIEIKDNFLDLGTTPIENMFINTFLSKANAVQIKVYIYALSYAYSGKGEITNENIASEMGLTEGEVVDAWKYWISEGVVEKKDDKYIFKSVRYQYLNSMYNIEGEEENILPKEIQNKNTYDENIYDTSEMAVQSRELIDNIESFIGKKLVPREIRLVLGTMNDFNCDTDFLSYAYMTASSVRGLKSVDPVMATIRNWMIDGITTIEDLENHLKSIEESKNKKTNKKEINAGKKNTLASKDNRMSKEERLEYIQKKMQKKIPIVKRKDQ